MKKISKIKDESNTLLRDDQVTHGLKRALRNLLKEISIYENHIKGKKRWEREKEKHSFDNIQIGGGKNTLKGFFNIDIVPPADLIYDVREGIPLEDNCSNFIFSEHFLEHVDYFISAKRIVKDCYRILKPGGKIVIGVPDSGLAIEKYHSKDPAFYKEVIEKWYSKRDFLDHINTYIDLLNYHFRDQDDSEKYNPHLWSYDYEKLESILKEFGFKDIKRWNFDKSIANPKREFGSVYVVGTK